VTLEVVPLNTAAGFALRLRVRGQQAGDQLVWSLGAVRGENGNPRDRWDPVMHGNPDIAKFGDPRKPEARIGMVPEACLGNQVSIDGLSFRLRMKPGSPQETIGTLDCAGRLLVADASAAGDPARLAESRAKKLPILCGVVNLRPGEHEMHWAVQVAQTTAAAGQVSVAAPAPAFANATAYLQSVERVLVETPEPRLDAAVAAVCHPIDAACDRQPTLFRHGCMSFFIHFVGWRVIFGSTALGWHERVNGNAEYYIAHQVKEDKTRIEAFSDPTRLYTHEGGQSRFHGSGKIANSPGMYNTQSQFFDQTIHEWRWTADPGLEKVLRPALERHLDWARECFDPDDDGLYESYINTLPTDSVWYNGGGSVEESAYAFFGHRAARDMARRAGDMAAAQRHQSRADKIQRALRQVLWLPDRGHFGLYVEQGGHKRVHSDAWVYSQFLPIDAGLCTPSESIQALYYTEWGLERVRLPFGGTLCQPSNWVPSKWSVRDIFNGDVWHLALAYDQIGLADEGWELLLGAMLESCYAGVMPGGFSHIGAGADFADSKDMFARVVVEGLFGYDPDYPNGVVRMHPAFPSVWPRASIHTPDYVFSYRQEGDCDTYRLTLAKEAAVEFRLPVRAKQVARVTLNGRAVPWNVEAGFGCTHLSVRTETPVKTADLSIELSGRVPQTPAVNAQAMVGSPLRLVVPRGHVGSWQDFHGIVADAKVDDSAVIGHAAKKPGHHMVLVESKIGELPQQQIFKIQVTDPRGEAERVTRTPREAPKDARWDCLDLRNICNGDIRTIYQQKYLSPRPKTCSVRIGVDGWSAWTFPYWGNRPPEIDLGNVPRLTTADGRIMTPQNVPFTRWDTRKNIAFTSLWDNWPRLVRVPVGKQADTVWLLVCGSTNPMQLRIANAEIRFRYADGQIETLEIVPPMNFWSLSSWGGKDYCYESDAFAMPKTPPPMVQLGKQCRAIVLAWKLQPALRLEDITIETLSQEVVIGIMGVSLMNLR
jgi:hypothetical protein